MVWGPGNKMVLEARIVAGYAFFVHADCTTSWTTPRIPHQVGLMSQFQTTGSYKEEALLSTFHVSTTQMEAVCKEGNQPTNFYARLLTGQPPI
jgi:hypothetical protein